LNDPDVCSYSEPTLRSKRTASYQDAGLWNTTELPTGVAGPKAIKDSHVMQIFENSYASQ